MTKPSLTYKDAGVDVDAGNTLVNNIKPLIKSTSRPGVVGNIGGFGGLFDLFAAAPNYQNPLLVAATDGVGTKLAIAKELGDHSTIGIDLVAMVVNDLVVQGAEPLFFLDYFATSALDITQAESVIEGIAEGCRQAGCAIIGGETAELPGMYQSGEYDLAGFGVGVVEKSSLLPKSEQTEAGDVLIALPSSGVHSNGFSLVRRIIAQAGVDYTAPLPGTTHTLGQALLAPTRIYVESCLPLAQQNLLKAMAHITGGGLSENIPRVLPQNTHAVIEGNALPTSPLFAWLKAQGNIQTEEMLRTFNCGCGMVLVVAKAQQEQVLSQLQSQGEEAWVLGHIAEGAGPVRYNNLDAWDNSV